MSNAVAMQATEGAPELVLANATLVLADEVVTGSVRIAGGLIGDMATGAGVPSGAVDCHGQLVVPGLVELHTDNLERHLMPRPKVNWPGDAAVVAHDGELAAAGITTVFDAVRVGSVRTVDDRDYARYARNCVDHICRLVATGLLRIDHRVHLRAEICSETVLEELEEFGDNDLVSIVSLMDHTPGQRQWSTLSKYFDYQMGKFGMTEAQVEERIAFWHGLRERLGARHEEGVVAHARRFGAVLASHDDTTAEHVARSVELGVDFAEFPTTLEAARACREAGIPVMMGGPNILRGGSHSGNVAAIDLARDGLLDILSSDYVPAALLMGAMRMAREIGDLPAAIATVTRAPAMAAGLHDRGVIEIGKRADLLTLGRHGDLSIVTGVWAAGRKVA